MKTIIVHSRTEGRQEILIDDSDFEWLNQWKWSIHRGTGNKTLYANRRDYKTYGYKNPKEVLMHRLILGLTDSSICADHKDGNGLNNQRENLRLATRSQNAANILRKAKSSKYNGVCWHKSNNKWAAQLKKNGKVYSLGCFKNEEDAAKAYNEAAIQFHGEFARLNKIA